MAVSDVVRTEQTKLLATAINNVAVAFVIVGFVTPVTAASFGIANAPAVTPRSTLFALAWVATGFALHWLARRALRGLRS